MNTGYQDLNIVSKGNPRKTYGNRFWIKLKLLLIYQNGCNILAASVEAYSNYIHRIIIITVKIVIKNNFAGKNETRCSL